MDGSSGTHPPVLSLNSSAVLMVEFFWLLVWSSVHCYKERHESDSTSSKQACADPDITSGLSTAGARLKKVMRRRFKMVDGVEYFEVHKGEWARSDSAPVGPCKTCKGHGSIQRHWVWNCPRWESRIWRPSRRTRHQCYNGWTASEMGDLCWRPPLWLPGTSSTGRRWWMHGKSWGRPTPRSAQRPAWFQRGDRQRGEPTRATFGDFPSSGALSNRGKCRCWRKRSSSPCLPRARRQRRPEDAYPPSRQWLPWGGSPPYNGTGYGEFPRRRWIPRGSDSSGGPTSSSSWPNHAPGWGSGKFMLQRSCPSPHYAGWEKYRRFADRTSPRWESRTRGSNETMAKSQGDWDHTRRHGLHGSAGSPLVRRQRWDEQRTSTWVWPSSCRGRTEERPDGMPGGEQVQPPSVGWDCRGGTSCGGGRWHSIKIAHLYASRPDEFECVQTTRLPWPATEGIRWRKTDIRDLWPASLVELFENDENVQKSPTEAKRTRSTRGDGGAEKVSAAAGQTVSAGRQERGGHKSRRTVAAGATEAEALADIEPPGGTRSVDPMPARGRADNG